MTRGATYDVLILGAGIAGLTAAVHLADAGRKVAVINRSFDPEESNTKYAHGGINWWGEDDSPELYATDIDAAGDEVGSLEAIKVLAEEGGGLVESFLIKRLGVPFDKDDEGHIHLTAEAAHSRKRIIHVKDQTGAAIETALVREARAHDNIRILEGHTAVDLLSSTHHATRRGAVDGNTRILGAYVLDRVSGEVRMLLASYTIIATGGVGAIFKYTTNPEGARGDGIALAERAGAHIVDMEYVQFHPTAFTKPGGETFLISEAVRGEGGILVNDKGARFMTRYRPDLMELAPRDEVARAIDSEMKERKIPNVWLDARPIAARGIDLEKRFPKIFEKCLAGGIDIRREPIPVAPAAHYLCGGVRVDTWGRTNLEKLYAIGEVSRTGLHGANRLASTSLEEGMLWGKRAALNIAGTFEREDFANWKVPDWDESDVRETSLPAGVAGKMRDLGEIMWNAAGIVRTEATLSTGWRTIALMRIMVEEDYRKTKVSDELIGLRNALHAAQLVIEQARRNKMSRGCHFRADGKETT